MAIPVTPSLVISIIAIGISLAALWLSHLSPFNLHTTNSNPRFTLYDESEPNQGAWIPSFDMRFTFHNTGQRVGKVYDLRIVATHLESGDKSYSMSFFNAVWAVDVEGNANRQDRSWLYSSIRHDWYPILIRGNDEKSIHVVLELDPPVKLWYQGVSGNLHLSLQLRYDGSDGWEEIQSYRLTKVERAYDVESLFAIRRGDYRSVE